MPEITQERLDRLQDAETRLQLLEAGGVDNWDGYDDCLADYWEQKAAEDRRREWLDEVADDICECICSGIEEPAGHGCGYGVRERQQQRLREILNRDCDPKGVK